MDWAKNKFRRLGGHDEVPARRTGESGAHGVYLCRLESEAGNEEEART